MFCVDFITTKNQTWYYHQQHGSDLDSSAMHHQLSYIPCVFKWFDLLVLQVMILNACCKNRLRIKNSLMCHHSKGLVVKGNQSWLFLIDQKKCTVSFIGMSFVLTDIIKKGRNSFFFNLAWLSFQWQGPTVLEKVFFFFFILFTRTLTFVFHLCPNSTKQDCFNFRDFAFYRL